MAMPSLQLTPEEKAEIEEALKHRIPYWRKPRNIHEWEQLLGQRAYAAISATKTHECGQDMPLWFRQMTAKSRYNQWRKYLRTKRRVEWEKLDSASKLLNMIFGRTNAS